MIRTRSIIPIGMLISLPRPAWWLSTTRYIPLPASETIVAASFTAAVRAFAVQLMIALWRIEQRELADRSGLFFAPKSKLSSFWN